MTVTRSARKRTLALLQQENEFSSNNNVTLPEGFIQKHDQVLVEACVYILKQDPTLYETIVAADFIHFLKTQEAAPTDLQAHFTKLASAILSQQISGHAAQNIKKRVRALYKEEFPHYREIVETFADEDKEAQLLACGLSSRKMSYLNSLATYFQNNESELNELFSRQNNDDEVIGHLVQNVKGIGPWTAKMFLVTSLRRLNIFAPDDLGIAKGCSRYLTGRPELLKELIANRVKIKKSKIKHKSAPWKVYDDDLMELCAEKFAPYRSIFMFLLWRMASTNVDSMIKSEKEFAEN